MLERLEVRTPLNDVYEAPCPGVSKFDMSESGFRVLPLVLYEIQKVAARNRDRRTRRLNNEAPFSTGTY
jgi:hypothetical protein